MAGTSPNNDVLSWGRIGKYLLDAIRNTTAGAAAILRTTTYGELGVQNLTAKPIGIQTEGSYYICRSPTVGTGIASIAALTAFVDTSPYIIITNNNPPGGKDIHLDFIRMICTVAGTSATALNWASKIDTIARYSSGGSGGSNTGLATVLSGPFPTNTGAPYASNALVYAGALVAVASSPNNRVIDDGPIRTTIMVANDQITWNFGGQEQQMDTVAIATATATQRFITHVPVTLAPGSSYLHYIWSTGQAAAQSWEIVIGYVER